MATEPILKIKALNHTAFALCRARRELLFAMTDAQAITCIRERIPALKDRIAALEASK